MIWRYRRGLAELLDPLPCLRDALGSRRFRAAIITGRIVHDPATCETYRPEHDRDALLPARLPAQLLIERERHSGANPCGRCCWPTDCPLNCHKLDSLVGEYTDTASSASRQHWIDTGEHLPRGAALR